MKKDVFRLIVFFTIVITLSVLMTSCGSRKVIRNSESENVTKEFLDKSVSEKQTESEVKTDTNVKRTKQVSVDDKDQTTTKKEIVEPIDNSKPALYKDEKGNVQELNNAKKTTETTTKNNNTKTDVKVETSGTESKIEKAKVAEKENKDIDEKTELKKEFDDKSVENSRFSFMGWLAVIVVFPLIIFLLHKFTNIFK